MNDNKKCDWCDIRFIVPGNPVAKGRHRVATKDRSGRSLAHPRMHTPVKTKDYQALVKLYALQARQSAGIRMFTGAVRVDITFFMKRPDYHFGKGKNYNEVKPRYASGCGCYHIIKPDRDNLDKAILDAMNGIIYKDDCQVAVGTIIKMYTQYHLEKHHLDMLTCRTDGYAIIEIIDLESR